MKELKQYIFEKLVINKDYKSLKDYPDEAREFMPEFYELVNKYCEDNGNSDNVGGSILGALAYMLYRFRNDGDTCDNNEICKRANTYLCYDINLRRYSEDFSDLMLSSYNNYGKNLYRNIRVALEYLSENEDLFKEKQTFFKIYRD